MAMTSPVENNTTRCSRCDVDLAYRFEVANGGGFHYDVSCPVCGDVICEVYAPPLIRMSVAA